MRNLRKIYFVGCLAAAPAVHASSERFANYSGVAQAAHSDTFLYAETHFLVYRDDRIAERVVLYLCQDGSAFARKTVEYADLTAPDFVLDDASNGMREGVRTDGHQRSVFFRGNRIEPEKSKPLPRGAALVADAGFDEFIRAKWSALMTGNAVPLRFLVPSRLNAVSFTAQRVRSDTVNGVAGEVIRLKLGGVLGVVLPSIDVTYGVSDHLLLRYEGVSDLRDASGNNYQAVITFRPEDRSEGEPRGIIAARAAPLAACR